MDWKGLIALHLWAQSWPLRLCLMLGHARCWLRWGDQLMLKLPVQAVRECFLR